MGRHIVSSGSLALTRTGQRDLTPQTVRDSQQSLLKTILQKKDEETKDMRRKYKQLRKHHRACLSDIQLFQQEKEQMQNTLAQQEAMFKQYVEEMNGKLEAQDQEIFTLKMGKADPANQLASQKRSL